MPIELDYYTKLKPVLLDLKDKQTVLDGFEFTTQQGITLKTYNFLLSANDCSIKNYTDNYLSYNFRYDDIFDKELPELINDSIVGKIYIANALSGTEIYLTLIPNQSSTSSQAVLTGDDSNYTQNFVINFQTINNADVCSIWSYDGLSKKYLFVREDLGNILTFNSLSSSHFNYLYDQTTDTINLFYTLSSGEFRWITYEQLPTLTYTLSVGVPSVANTQKIGFKVLDYAKTLTAYNINNYVQYASGVEIDENTSLLNVKNNFLLHTSYEDWLPTATHVQGTLNYFNLKNYLSNNNFVNRLIPLEDRQQRNYNSIITNEYEEISNEKLQLGYNFYTKEYLIKPDKYTKFVLPDTITPYNTLNINDAGFAQAGAYAANSPYFSDRVYKLQNNNLNTNNDNESNGVFLCAWLNTNGRWYDRYYIPENVNYVSALTSGIGPVFNHQSELDEFITSNGLQDVQFYDVQSSLMLEPSGTYYYARIGNKYISSVLSGKDENIVKQDFDIISNINNSVDQKASAFFDGTIHDKFNLGEYTSGRFNISFRLNTSNFGQMKAYQLVGNNYNVGFSLRKNFYFTPFVLLYQQNNLFFYDSEFNLIKKNEYDVVEVGNILDACYVTQTNDIVIRTTNGLFRTDITGQIINSNTSTFSGLKTSVASRTFYGHSNRGLFITDDVTPNPLYIVDFQTLTTELSTTISDGRGSVVSNNRGKYVIYGDKGVCIDNTYAASISGNTVLFTDLSTFSTFTALSTNKEIYDINSYNDRLYIYTDGKIKVFNTDRELLSTITLSPSAYHGAKIEFVVEDYTVKLLAFSRNIDNMLLIDKISLTDGKVLSTYQLNVSAVSGTNTFLNPTGFNYVYNTYKDYEDKITFTAKLQNTIAVQSSDRIWSTFSHSWSAAIPTEYWAFSYSDITSLTDNSVIDTLPVGNNESHIDMDFNLLDGVISIYTDGILTNEISIPANSISIDNIVKNITYVGNQNYATKAITDYVSNQNFLGINFTISDFRVYNISLSDDFIKYLYMKGIDIESVNIDILCGTRNNTEAIDNIYKYNIPGRMSNKVIVYVKGLGITESSKNELVKILDQKLKKVLPVNISEITYNLDIQ